MFNSATQLGLLCLALFRALAVNSAAVDSWIGALFAHRRLEGGGHTTAGNLGQVPLWNRLEYGL